MTSHEAVAHLERLVDYHAWVGRRLLDAAERLSPGDLAGGELAGGSVFQTLRHVLDVTWSWRRAAAGLPDVGLLWEVEPLEDLAALRAYWQAEDERLAAFVASLGPADLERRAAPPSGRGDFRIADIVTHAVIHQVEHGNELSWQLTRAGQSPGELGFLAYVLERE